MINLLSSHYLKPSEKASTPHLDRQYPPPVEDSLPTTLDTLTSLPRAFFSRGRNWSVTSITPIRFTSSTFVKSSSCIHSVGPKGMDLPALFTRPHRPAEKMLTSRNQLLIFISLLLIYYLIKYQKCFLFYFNEFIPLCVSCLVLLPVFVFSRLCDCRPCPDWFHLHLITLTSSVYLVCCVSSSVFCISSLLLVTLLCGVAVGNLPDQLHFCECKFSDHCTHCICCHLILICVWVQVLLSLTILTKCLS